MEYSVIVLLTVCVRQLVVGHGVERGVCVGHAHFVFGHTRGRGGGIGVGVGKVNGEGGGGGDGVGIGQARVVRSTLQMTLATRTCDSRVFPVSKDSLLAGHSTSLDSLPAHRIPLRSTLRLGLPKGKLMSEIAPEQNMMVL